MCIQPHLHAGLYQTTGQATILSDKILKNLSNHPSVTFHSTSLSSTPYSVAVTFIKRPVTRSSYPHPSIIMHFQFTPFALLLAISSLAAADNQQFCSTHHPFIYGAINQFCSKTDMVVPSKYATDGVKASNGAYVKITGNCSPAQWVPSYWCTEQLLQVCAQTDGQGSQRFGRNGCQTFTTSAPWELHPI